MKRLLLIARTLPRSKVKHFIHQPTLAEILGVDNSSAPKLHALASVIHPSKVQIERRLNNAKHDGNRIPKFLRTKTTHKPI